MPFTHGDRVRVVAERDRIGTIQGQPRRFAGELYYSVAFSDGTSQSLPEPSLELFKEAADVRTLIETGSFGNRQNFSAIITLTKLQGDLSNNVYAFYASRTQFFPHQFKPVLKYVDSPKKRILVADEVGLGKTIEAGLIMAEERARNLLRRVLVVCPSALRQKWQREMSERFDEEFRILNRQELLRFIQDVAQKGDTVQLRGIVGLQTIRGDSVLEQLQAVVPHIDLVIVDEAHHMRNPGTLSHQAGRALSDCADGMVLMTATPIHLGNENLFNLLRILDEEEFQELRAFEQGVRSNEPIVGAQRIMSQFPPEREKALRTLRRVEDTPDAHRIQRNPVYPDLIDKLSGQGAVSMGQAIAIQRDLSSLNLLSHILTRTRKREVPVGSPVRSPAVLKPEFTRREMQCYTELTGLCIEWYAKFSGNPVESLASITLQRQLASCLPATIEKYLGDGVINLSDSEEHGLTEEEMSEEVVEDAPPPSLSQDRGFLTLIRSYADLLNTDSKFTALDAYLKQLEEAGPGRQVIIFTYFKGTIAYLSRRLHELGYSCLTVSGDVVSTPGQPETDERGKRFDQFRNKKARILISSEVGSEGLDLQFCHILINYDLPWNPMVVEQRIGRIDRIGQESKRIVIAHFSIPGTIEERILTRLYNRIGIFERAIGELEPILGAHIRELTRILMSSKLTDAEKDEQLSQTAAALEHRKQELDALEVNSAHLIGQDEFFNMELDRVQRLRRFVTPVELRVLVEEFLRREYPACRLENGDAADTALMVVDPRLLQFLRDVLPETDRWLLTFLSRSSQGKLLVTFDSNTGFRRPDIEFLGNTHPLIRAIKAQYKAHPSSLHASSRVILRTSLVPEGDYLFEVFLVEITGIRSLRVLDPVFVSIEKRKVIGAELSEELLALIVESGETLEEMPELETPVSSGLLDIAENAFGERLGDRKTETQRANEILLAQRMTSLEGTYRVKLARQRSRVEKARAGASKPQFIGMLESTVKRLESEFEQKKRDIERGRGITPGFKLIAGGFLRVENP